MHYELRGHKLYLRILAHAEHQQRVLLFSVARDFGRTSIARYFFFHEILSQEAYREFDLSSTKDDGRMPSLNTVVAMARGGSPETLKTAGYHVLSDFFARHSKTTLSLSTSKGDALAFVRLIVNLDGIPYRVTFKMEKWTKDLAVSWQNVTGIVGEAAREAPTLDPWKLPPAAGIYS